MSLKVRQEYRASERRLVTAILWIVGNSIPYDCHKKVFQIVIIYSICVLFFQMWMAIINSWAIFYYYCCHAVADTALLLRLLYPNLIQLNAFIYQVIFLLNRSKIKRFFKELGRVIPYKSTSIRNWKPLVISILLAVFALSLLFSARLGACSLQKHYAIIYKIPQRYCDVIYIIPRVPTMASTILSGTYTKLIMQIISMALSTIGIVFTEFWISNILHTVATAFEESHDNLMPILKEEVKQREKRLKLVTQPFQHSRIPKFSKGFQIWRKQHYKLRQTAKRADSVLSPFALLHSLFTPVLLCLAGLTLLKKNQEPFMNFFEIRLASYHVICLCLLRMWFLCNAGEQLSKQTIDLASKMVKAQITGLPSCIQFQIRLLATITPTTATASQFFTLTRGFFLTMIGTTFTILVVLLQVKTDPNKFADKFNVTRTTSC